MFFEAVDMHGIQRQRGLEIETWKIFLEIASDLSYVHKHTYIRLYISYLHVHTRIYGL